MKNLRQLGFILSAGTIAALSLTGCGDETTPPPGTAGTSSAGTAAGGSGTSGSGTGGTSASGSSSGGGGAGGSAAGGGGAGGKGGTGGGGAGGTGGAGGATGGGGAGGTGGGPSAACMTYCGSSDNGVRQVCAGKFAPAAAGKLDTEAHCLESCAKPASAATQGVACWNMHTTLAKAEAADSAGRTMHCGHATGASTCDALP